MTSNKGHQAGFEPLTSVYEAAALPGERLSITKTDLFDPFFYLGGFFSALAHIYNGLERVCYCVSSKFFQFLMLLMCLFLISCPPSCIFCFSTVVFVNI